MAVKYPSAEKMLFLLADDLRHENNNKISLMGMYFNDVRVETNNVVDIRKTPIPLSLVFMFAFRDGEGSYTSQFYLTGPDGKEIWKSEPQDIAQEPGHAMVTAYKLPHKYAELGTYKVRLQLDDRSYESEFELKLGSADSESKR